MTDTSAILETLRALGFVPAGTAPDFELLPGGVSSHVYKVDLPTGPVCVKQVLPRLNVKADWRAPVERVHNEAQWFRFAASVVPGSAPAVLAEDRGAHLFVMTYFEPSSHPGWKNQLRDGIVDPAFAAKVGALAARLHAASAGSKEIEKTFAYDGYFMALRIDPYLLHAAKANPDRAERIEAIAASIARARIALMHGDYSPKNILVGPDGPIILDAETACYGDPAFDLAFCLNHLLLKCVWKPEHADAYAESFRALAMAYLAGVNWENPLALSKRAAAILPALLLARVDGKSPVEYLTAAVDIDFVRRAARDYLMRPEFTLDAVLEDWQSRIENR